MIFIKNSSFSINIYMYENYIPIEIDTIGNEGIHTYKYMSIQKMSILIPIERIQ